MAVQVSAPLQLGHYQALDIAADGAPVPLGAGAYAGVFRFMDSYTGEQYAVKRIRLVGLPPATAAILKRFLRKELMHHAKLRHPHVTKLREVFVASSHINIVMELCHGGTLLGLMQRLGEAGLQAGEAAARWFFQQLVLTIHYCHEMGVAHRDVKLENTLLKTRVPVRAAEGTNHLQLPAPRPLIAVSDFGVSKDINSAAAGTAVGTVVYMAPEVMVGTPITQGGAGGGGGYDPVKADIFSAGVALYVMLVGAYPFDGASTAQHLAQIQAPLNLPAALSDEVKDLLHGVLAFSPAERLDMQAVLDHPWFGVGLPAGALDMTQRFRGLPSPAVQTLAQIEAVVNEALAIVDADQQAA